MTDAIERFHAVNSLRLSMGGLRWYWRWRAWIACQTASMRLADAACVIRSQVRAFSVSVLIGNKSLTAFRAIAHAIAITQIHTHRRNRYGSCRDGEGGALDGRAMAKGPGISLPRAS